MRRARSLAFACALTVAATAALAVTAPAAPQESTLDAQIEHGLSGCRQVPPDKKAFGMIPPGYDYRFTVTSAAEAHPMIEAHRTLASAWERSFKTPPIPRAAISRLKRELRLPGSTAAAWLIAEESQIDDLLSAQKPGKPITYEVALLGCTGTAGAYDTIMALKEFEVAN